MDEDYAYKMGLDCVMNGPNTTNCNFAIFAKPEFTRAWEQGHEGKDKQPEDSL